MKNNAAIHSLSLTETKSRIKRDLRKETLRKQFSQDEERSRQQELPGKIKHYFDQMCQKANPAYSLYLKVKDLNDQVERVITYNESLDDPSVKQVIVWMVSLGSIFPIAFIDYFLLNGFSTYLISIGGTTVASMLILVKILIVLALIWIEVVIGNRMQREDGSLPWHAFLLAIVVSVITGVTFFISVSAPIDGILASQIVAIMAVAFICHALCIRLSSVIHYAIAWLRYQRLRKRTIKWSAKLLPAVTTVYLEYMAWLQLHERNHLVPDESTIPKHVTILLRFYNQFQDEGQATSQSENASTD